VFVSAATAWEISIKQALGKLEAPDDLEAALAVSRFQPLPITVAHTLVAGRLPRHHDDPFDRMLIAHAQHAQLTVVTHDPKFRLYMGMGYRVVILLSVRFRYRLSVRRQQCGRKTAHYTLTEDKTILHASMSISGQKFLINPQQGTFRGY